MGVLMVLVRVVKSASEGVMPPTDWSAQSSMRSAPAAWARSADSRLKHAISRGILDFFCLFSARRWVFELLLNCPEISSRDPHRGIGKVPAQEVRRRL